MAYDFHLLLRIFISGGLEAAAECLQSLRPSFRIQWNAGRSYLISHLPNTSPVSAVGKLIPGLCSSEMFVFDVTPHQKHISNFTQPKKQTFVIYQLWSVFTTHTQIYGWAAGHDLDHPTSVFSSWRTGLKPRKWSRPLLTAWRHWGMEV